MNLDPIVAALSKRRRQIGVPQQLVVRAMGYASRSTLSLVERGRREPSLDLVRRLATVLGCEIALVPLDADGELDEDPTPPGELLTHAQRRERLAKLAASDLPAGTIARRLGVSERTVHRRRAKDRTAGRDG